MKNDTDSCKGMSQASPASYSSGKPTMNQTTLPELLDRFSVKELLEALFQANLPQAGTKNEKIKRLCSLEKPPHELLDLFTAEALRIVCDSMEVQPGRKSEMITRLLSVAHVDVLIPEASFTPRRVVI